MANNFFLNQDPLLFQSPYTRGGLDEDTLQQQIMQYKMLQQQNQINQAQNNGQRDYIGELDKLMKSLSDDVSSKLLNDDEYKELNNELQSYVQEELMSNIRWRLNFNQNVIKNIEKQTEIINNANKETESEKRKNLSELNDYVKNYSNITFDEYKKIKNKKNNKNKEEINTNENK